MKSLLKIIKQHKLALVILIIVLAISGYYLWQKQNTRPTETRYVLAAVEKGTLITSVTGSGQISVTNQMEIKAKASGDIVKLNIKNGQEVKAGASLIWLNDKEAQKNIRDAQLNIESAKLSLEKLKIPANALTLLQAQNALTQAQENKKDAEDNLIKIRQDGFITVSNAFLQLPDIMQGLDYMLYGNTESSGIWDIDFYYNEIQLYEPIMYQYRQQTSLAYKTAKAAYDLNFANFKTVSQFSDQKTIENLIDDTYKTTQTIGDAIRTVNNYIQFYKDTVTERSNEKTTLKADDQLTTLTSYISQTNSHLTNLLNIKDTIKINEDTLIEAGRTIAEKTESLAQLQAEPDALEIRTQEISLQQKINALTDAQDKIADYTVRAPFDGVIAEFSLIKGQDVSSGGAVATLITKQKMAEIALNEVDMAKVKVGQKVTLTFDAIENLTISGEVGEIDSLGTVSQGVVSYNVKILFDTQDERVKPSMSVSASIITEIKQDVLTIPNAAIKTSNEINYVEMPDEIVADNATSNTAGVTLTKALKQQVITVGLANDSSTEVIEGLKEGDLVVTRTSSSTAKNINTQSTGSSLFQMGGSAMGRPRD